MNYTGAAATATGLLLIDVVFSFLCQKLTDSSDEAESESIEIEAVGRRQRKVNKSVWERSSPVQHNGNRDDATYRRGYKEPPAVSRG